MTQQTCQSCGRRAFQEVLTFQERRSPSRDTEETGRGADSGGERLFFPSVLFKNSLLPFPIPAPVPHAFVSFSEKYRCLENTLGQFLLFSIFMAGNPVLCEFFKIQLVNT